MRNMTFEHNGETYTLAATFAASVEIADKVGDPLFIAREAALEHAMLQARIPYHPKFEFTVRNVPQILAIGFKAAGDPKKLEEVQEMVFEAGFVHARLWVADYMALIVEPKPSAPEVEIEDEIGDEGASGNVPSSKAGVDA